MPLVSLPGGQLRDEIRQPVYDGIIQQAAESPIGIRQFFSAVQGKARYLTNLRQNNLLETAVSFRVQGMSLDAMNYDEANRRLLPLVLIHSSLNLRVGEKIYYEAPLTFLSGRIEASHAISRSSGTGEVAGITVERLYQKLGQSAVAPVVLTGRHVIDILPLQSFSATMTTEGMTAGEIVFATPAQDTKILYLYSLKGLLRRPVQ